MTVYFRRFKIRNPLRSRHKSYLETVLAAEAAEKKEKEKAVEKAAKQHVSNSVHRYIDIVAKIIQRVSLARLEGRETTWHRAIRRVRSLWLLKIPQRVEFGDVEGDGEEAEVHDEDENDAVCATAEEVAEGELWGEWEGKWTEILEYYV